MYIKLEVEASNETETKNYATLCSLPSDMMRSSRLNSEEYFLRKNGTVER